MKVDSPPLNQTVSGVCRNTAAQSKASVEVSLKLLAAADWGFEGEDTSYLTHNLHPYPARFPPQIPARLIQALSQPGDVILDPFCGSGTTLLEAALTGHDAIGIDANPLAVLISRAKTRPLSPAQLEIARDTVGRISDDIEAWYGESLIASLPTFEIPGIPKLDFWFKPFVVNELALIRHHLTRVSDEHVAQLLKVSFSSIIVTVSNQDSDTRYVRREKRIKPKDILKMFRRRALTCIDRARHLTTRPIGQVTVHHADARSITFLKPQSLGLIITSPPYPNAYSYHLYHRYRMLWLGMDPDSFKRDEIGSHRKYSKRQNGETEETFFKEMVQVFSELCTALCQDRFCCIIIGDSLVRGRIVANDRLMLRVAHETGFKPLLQLRRELQQTKRAFNPKIGRISTEHILIWQKS